MAAAAPDAARALREQLAEEDWDHPILETVVAIVERRARQLARIAA
jgi:hypothetical protein